MLNGRRRTGVMRVHHGYANSTAFLVSAELTKKPSRMIFQPQNFIRLENSDLAQEFSTAE